MDNWNIKDKEKIFAQKKSWCCDARCGLYSQSQIRNEDFDDKEYYLKDGQKAYLSEDIKLLYQKLIEDISNLVDGGVKYAEDTDYVEISLGKLKDIINKRFGINE